jgi:hypothetical protein
VANLPTIFLYTPIANQTIGCPSGNTYESDLHQLIYNPAPGDVAFLVSIGCIELNGRNNVSSVAPTSANDNTQLYGVGSLWFSTTTSTLYACTSAATGAAVWAVAGSGTSVGSAETVHGSSSIAPPNTTIYVDNTSAAPTVMTLDSPYGTNSNVTSIDTAANFGAYPCTITPSSGTIRGLASFALVNNGQKETFNFDGTNWW